jgi:hypothetical protein
MVRTQRQILDPAKRIYRMRKSHRSMMRTLYGLKRRNRPWWLDLKLQDDDSTDNEPDALPIPDPAKFSETQAERIANKNRLAVIARENSSVARKRLSWPPTTRWTAPNVNYMASQLAMQVPDVGYDRDFQLSMSTMHSAPCS